MIDESNQLTDNMFFIYSNHALDRLRKNNIKFSYYTNAETGFKIINDEKIWMRNVRCMNDYSEFEWGKRVLFKALLNKSTRKRLNVLFSKLGRESFDIFFEGPIKGFIDGANKRTYITCLSEHDVNDEAERKYGRLSMWRAYGGTSGIALILNTDFLENEDPLGDRALFVTSPVLYEENVNEHLNKILDRIESYLTHCNHSMYEYISTNLLIAFYIAALSIKHPAFKEEKEWRIILSFYNDSEDANLKGIVGPAHETIGGVPQKIYKINLRNNVLHNTDVKSLLNQVLIGPTVEPEIIKEAFESLLLKKGIDIKNDLVHTSYVPLRK